MFSFSKISKDRMTGVHPSLISVAERALSYGILDLTVPPYGGVRSPADQKKLVDAGKSQTLRSKHLIQKDGYGHALDLTPFPIDWENTHRFDIMGGLMFRAAMELDVKIEWGGHWIKFKDMPHFQIATVK